MNYKLASTHVYPHHHITLLNKEKNFKKYGGECGPNMLKAATLQSTELYCNKTQCSPPAGGVQRQLSLYVNGPIFVGIKVGRPLPAGSMLTIEPADKLF